MAETGESKVATATEAAIEDKTKTGNDAATDSLQKESVEIRETETEKTDLKEPETESSIVPDLEIVDSEKAEVKMEEKPLTAAEKRATNFLQQQIINVFSIAQPRPENMSDEDYKEHVRQGVEKVQAEKDAGVFGPATQEAYKNTVTWLEKQAVPGAITELTRLQLPLPSGTPLALPPDIPGRVISLDLYKQMVDNGRLTPDLKLDTTKVPSDLELEKIDDTMRWLKEVDTRALEAREEQQDSLLEQEIKRLLPDEAKQKQWLDRKGSDPKEWRAAAIEAVDLATRVRNYVEAMDSLNRAGHRFNFEAPPGSEIVRDDKGRITHVKLDLPKDLRLDHPANKQKMENLRQWMQEHGEEVDQALKELIKLEQDPDRLLFWGEIDMPEGRVRLDNKGDISDFVAKEDVNGSEKYYNLADLEFDVKEVEGEDGKKKIVITNDVQYKYSNWYNYLNIGADHVGNEINVESREYDPEDWVPVRNGGKVEIMKARDLASWRTRQQVFHYGEKALIATLDTAMLVTGTIQVGAAVKAARAGQILIGQAVKQSLKGGLRATVGASGIVNNAYFQNTEYGQNIQMARGLYFVGDAALGLGAGGWRLARNLTGGAEAAKAGQSVEALVEAQIKGSKWLNRINTPAEFGAKMTELPFALIIGQDIYHQVESMSEIGRNDPTRAALRQGLDGQGDQKPEETTVPAIDTEKGKIAELDRYNTLLTGEKENPEVKEIIEKTRALIEGDASQEEIDEYKGVLMDRFMPDGSKVKDRSSDLAYLSDKSKGHLGYAEEQNRAVQTAAALALLQLSRNEDGTIPDTIGEREIEIGRYTYEVTTPMQGPHGGSRTETKVSDARTESQVLKRSDLANFLRREIESPKEESRLVASSDLALQLGVADGREVAGILQDVVAAESSTDREKAEAILRLGVTVDALKIQERVELTAQEQFKEDSMKVGLSAKAVESFLKNVSINSKNPDHRTAAALMVFANSETNPDTRKSMIRSYSEMLGKDSSEPGKFARNGMEVLKQELVSEDSSGERKLNAASAILDLVNGSDSAESKALQVKAYESIAALVKGDDVPLATRAMGALTPEGIKILNEQNPRLASLVRDYTVEILRDTDRLFKENFSSLTPQIVQERVELIKAVKPIIEDGDQSQKSYTEQTLIGFINQKSASFADFSPAIRKASIQTLTDLGSRGALTVLREAVAGDENRRLEMLEDENVPESVKRAIVALQGDSEEESGQGNERERGIDKDWDASVRYEALKAMETLKDPKLRPMVLLLAQTETDPTVSARLFDIKFVTERLDPSSEEYRKEFERTAAALMRDPMEGWDDLAAEIKASGKSTESFVEDWRDSSFSLLDGTRFNSYRDSEGDKAAKAVYSGFGGTVSWIFSYRSTIDREEAKARNNRRDEVTTTRNNQFERLIDRAALRSKEGMMAKMALMDILVDGGQPFSSNESAWAQRKAAEAFYNLAKPGVENRDYVFWAIQTGLTGERSMDKEARRWLLKGLDELTKEDKNGERAITKEEAAITAAKALDLQNTQRAPYTADATIQSQLIDTIVANGHHKTYPVLEALAAERKGTPLGNKAEEALYKMRDSVVQIWRDTAKDTTTTPAQRALNIQEALQDDNNSQRVIEAIFAASKQSAARDITDPRIAVLKVAMNSPNERVRLAAAGSLLEIGARTGVDLSNAVSILETIEAESAVEGYKVDAAIYLKIADGVNAR